MKSGMFGTNSVSSAREVGRVGTHGLTAPLRLLPLLLAPQRGEVEEVVRASCRLETARELRVRVEDPTVDREEAASPRHVVWLLRRLHALVAQGGVLVEGAVVVLTEAARLVDRDA